MRFGRKDAAAAPGTQTEPAIASVERVVRRTSRGMALVTLALIAALLGTVGFVTAAVALRATDEQVDRSLQAAADVRLAALEEQAALLAAQPGPGPTASPDDGDGDGDGDGDNSGPGSGNSGPGSGNSGSGGEDDDPSPDSSPDTAASPTPTPVATLGLGNTNDRPPESADTFFLLVSTTGEVLSNPQEMALAGLPDDGAVAAALATGDDDWRTVTANGLPMRLLTQRIEDGRGGVAGILQSGFVLVLQEQQRNQLLLTIVLASLAGLAGATLVTLLVTRRAMRPIRGAFQAERRFVASASHELRTPVAVVRSSAEILQREDLIKPDGRALVDDIISESDRLGRLVGDMLALASAEAGALTIDPREIEMRAFVRQVARRAESLAEQRNVRLEVLQEGEAAPRDTQLVVSADPDRMTQLLLIFIDNAIDHSPAGGTVRVFVRPFVDGGRPQVAVGVMDEGPGVPHAERARIFEPFARLRGRRRETGSTGLGLAIARVLAARQHASLHVDDAAGGGAVFSVRLPRIVGPHPIGSG